jgi:uncharacterized protein YbgA (DUF1722 family)/uncharacterized protein YbbK (DUF523 family)
MFAKSTIGISSCLLGNTVRYDGGHKLDHYLRDTLGQFVEWEPVCPEVEAGFSVPREPMQLVGDAGSLHLVTIQTAVDRTGTLFRWSRNKLKQLEQKGICGFVFKARSPSCGVRDTKIFAPSGRLIGNGSGLFAAEVATHFPSLPLEDEGRLQDPRIRENFIERVFVYKRWLEFKEKSGTIGDLVAFHAQHKYLIMSHSIKHLRELGSLVSNAKKYKRSELFKHYFLVLIDGLKLQATVKKHTNALQHMAGYFKKHLSSEEKRELLDVITRYHKGLVPLIVPITLINHYVRKYDEPYLKQQYYLNPHPIELMLRNHV